MLFFQLLKVHRERDKAGICRHEPNVRHPFAHRGQQEGSFRLAFLAPLFLRRDNCSALCYLRIADACRSAEGKSCREKKSG
jgi:hypothetical protein